MTTDPTAFLRRNTYIYDSDGNRLTKEEDGGCDGDCDGDCDEGFTYTYDAAGNMLTEEQNLRCDGRRNGLDKCTTYIYDCT